MQLLKHDSMDKITDHHDVVVFPLTKGLMFSYKGIMEWVVWQKKVSLVHVYLNQRS